MPDDITPAEAPAAEEAQEKSAEKSYTEAEHKAAVEAAVKARFSKFADYDEVKKAAAELAELKAAQMSEAEKAKAEADALRAELEASKRAQREAEIAALRVKVGTEKGLPSALIDRLAGDDAESIALDADAILAALPKAATAKGGANPPDNDSSNDDDGFASALGRIWKT